MKLTIFRISSLFLRFSSSRFHVFLLEHIRDELDTILSSVPVALLRAVISAAAHHSYTSLHSFTAISCWGMITIRHKDTAGRQKCSNSLVWTRLKIALHTMTNNCTGKTEETTRVDQVDSWISIDGNQPQTIGPAENWYEALMLQPSLVLWTTEVLAKPTGHVLWVRHMR